MTELTITEIPAITPLPVIDRTQPPGIVRPQVDAYFGTQLPTFTGQLNNVSAAIVQLGQDVLALRNAAAADKSAAEGFKTQAGLYASAADTSRGLAAAEKEAAALERAAAEDARDDAQDARDAAQTFATAAGASVGLPAPLASKPLAALRVKADGSGLEATYEAPAGDIKHISITVSTTLAAAHKGALIDVSGTGITITLNASALGNGWWCYLGNPTNTDLTLEASVGAIDGLSSYVMYPGEVRLLQCDGADIRTVVITPFFKTFDTSGVFVNPPGYTEYDIHLRGGAGGGGGGGSGAVGGSNSYFTAGAGGFPGIPGAEAFGRINAPAAGTTHNIVVGAEGIGGSGATTHSANGSGYTGGGGQAGTAGGASSAFGMYASGGVGGEGGNGGRINYSAVIPPSNTSKSVTLPDPVSGLSRDSKVIRRTFSGSPYNYSTPGSPGMNTATPGSAGLVGKIVRDDGVPCDTSGGSGGSSVAYPGSLADTYGFKGLDGWPGLVAIKGVL